MERTARERLLTFLLVPAIVVGVLVLGWVTFRTTFQLDKLRQQSVIEATLTLANEKVDRLDKRIVDEDNVVLAETDLSQLPHVAHRWLLTAARETPTVRAILVLDPHGPDYDIVAFTSRAGGGPEDDAFRRLLVARMVRDMDLRDTPPDELRHLHKTYGGQSYLVSYASRTAHNGRSYLIIAWHDVARIVHDMMPRILADTGSSGARFNVVDEDGRIVFGPPLRGGELLVGKHFPTTLYGWRLQVALTSAEELSANVERRRLFEAVMVGLSCVVVIAGILVVVFAAERERRLSAMKSDFVANVSHELKTPVSLVRMFGELLLSNRVASDEKRREYLQIILNESDRLTALIDNVLDFSKLEQKKSAFELAEGDIGQVASRAVEVYRYRAEREGVELRVELEDPSPRAVIDERAIELAIINLVDNALKYAKDGKIVCIEVRSRGRFAEIRVRDFGPGIPLEDRRRIFDRFVRGRLSANAQVRGSGIGLALVRHIAEAHGGKAWVESEVGEGSTFVLAIPMTGVVANEPIREASAG